MTQPALIVMAAGLGSRYGGLKQLDAFGPHGETMIDYCVYDALRAGFGRVVFVIRRAMEPAFREGVGRRIEAQADTAYVFQELDCLPEGYAVPAGREKPWGTGHAALCCADAVHGPCACINADDFYGAQSYRLLHDFLAQAADEPGCAHYGMAGFVIENTLSPHGTVARGICDVSDDGFLRKVVERTRIKAFGNAVKYEGDDGAWAPIPARSFASMNMWGFTPSVFEHLRERFARFLAQPGNPLKSEYFLPGVVGDLVADGCATVKVLPTQEKWFGVTYRDDAPNLREALKSRIAEGLYPERLWRA